jgi:hypothetical protein
MEFMVGQHTNVLHYEKILQPCLTDNLKREKESKALIRVLMQCIPVFFSLALVGSEVHERKLPSIVRGCK